MESIKHGFIKPDGTTIEVPKEYLGRFCRDVCLKYRSESEENKLLFNSYRDSYPIFIPYFQFIIDVLNWKYVGSLFSEKLDYQINTENYSLLDSVNSSNLAVDENGFILHDGKFIISNGYLLEHEDIARKILFSIMLNNDIVYEDYVDPTFYHYNYACDYLINRLGIIKIGSYHERKILECNERYLTEVQKSIIDEMKTSFGYRVREVHGYADDARKVKELIRKYRG